ncbi:hypothetical protein LZ554_004176 [Drepanopeziza brunnea f. sp. 'monogermtubi']|nr:hypothetical protein LZ554_004176 [Drepanopeziza brunnea f. sp. 'monogermtubi']
MAARTPHQHVYSLGMQTVHDSSDETDGDVSDFDLEAGYPVVQIGADDEESSGESGSEPAVSIHLDDSDADDEMSDRAPSPSPSPSPSASSSPSTLRLDLPAAAPAAPGPVASRTPSLSPAPLLPPPPPAAMAPAFNPAPSHFVRTHRGRSIVWSMADWAEQREAVLAAEARQLVNERRWAINGGRGPISRRRAWRRANAGRARDARGRFVRQ